MDAWTNLCRCCLCTNSEVSLIDSESNILEKFYEVTTVEVKHDDGLPQKLCTDCYTSLISAYQFRQQCMRMNSELKTQLAAIMAEANDNTNLEFEEVGQNNQKDSPDDDEEFANNPLKQLEAIIKKESVDNDDDCYYVLVIDDPKDKEIEDIKPTNLLDLSHVKIEQQDHDNEYMVLPENDETELMDHTHDDHRFENTIESFLVSNTKVPVNVPDTILENEEDSQDNQLGIMDVEETQDSDPTESILNEVDDSQNNIIEMSASDLVKDNNLIKLLTSSSADGTLILKNTEGIEYLPQLVMEDEDDDGTSREVILCEGDDTSQFQILKYDGSELVIEYADEGQITTVMQKEDGTFLCDCGEQFEDFADYQKHQHKHNPAGEHLCNFCGKGFESAEILTGHTLLHNYSSSSINCPFCNQFIKRNALTQHIKYGHNNIKPCCNVCHKTFANPNNLKRHMMIHNGIREFECDICFKRFNQKITMQSHRLTHLNPLSCIQCDKTFDDKDTLNAHKESGECSKSKVMIVKKELMKTVKKEITTNLGKLLGYACSLCKKMFSVESALEQHIESTHLVDPAELLCPECGEVLPSKKDMQNHVMMHKNLKNKNVKRFECSICGKGCSSQAMLLMHIRVHTNERPYPCGLCSLRFKTRTHLRTHQLTHTREKKFGCSVCMKFFALKGNLVVHLRTHTGERPYVCNICGDAFIDSKYLKKHKFKKHSLENVEQISN